MSDSFRLKFLQQKNNDEEVLDTRVEDEDNSVQVELQIEQEDHVTQGEMQEEPEVNDVQMDAKVLMVKDESKEEQEDQGFQEVHHVELSTESEVIVVSDNQDVQDMKEALKNDECKCPWCHLENQDMANIQINTTSLNTHVKEISIQVEDITVEVQEPILQIKEDKVNVYNEIAIQAQLSPEIVFMQQNNLQVNRKFSHNKFQLEIEDLNNIINGLKVQNANKDSELDLFKTNIRTIQLQLQEKTQIINELSESLLKERNTITKLQDEILENKTKLNLEKNNLDNLNKDLSNTNVELIKDKTELLINLENITNKYNELNDVYKNLLINFNQKTNNYQKLEISLKESNDQVNLYKEKAELMQTEITIMKSTLVAHVNEINGLKEQIASQICVLPEPEKENLEEPVLINSAPILSKNMIKRKGTISTRKR